MLRHQSSSCRRRRQVYIEQSDVAAEPAENSAQQYWYFCKGSNKYYPYVKECPGGWQKVLPQPAQ